MPRRRFDDRIPLERDIETLEQFGRPWGERTQRQEEGYSRAIGKLLIAFSILETALDHMIITSISDRADEEGYRIVKYLNFRNKTNLASDQYQRMINFITVQKLKTTYQTRLGSIIKKLNEMGEFRNKIAHANWESISEKGFVRVKVKEDSNGDGIHFERVKLTPSVISAFIRQMVSLANRIDTFSDRVMEDMHR